MNWFLIKNKTSSMTEALSLYKEARAPRDYKREYAQYHSKKEQIDRRSTRNKARRKLGLNKGDPREVDHKVPLSKGGGNGEGNLRAVSLQANRRKFTKTSSATPATVKCPMCGHMNSPSSEHCSNCGYRLGSDKTAGYIDRKILELGQKDTPVGRFIAGAIPTWMDAQTKINTALARGSASGAGAQAVAGLTAAGLTGVGTINPSIGDMVAKYKKAKAAVKKGKKQVGRVSKGVEGADQYVEADIPGIEGIQSAIGHVGNLFDSASELVKLSNKHHHLITGVPGAGKSTLAKRIAKEKGLPLFELDSDPRFKEALQLVDEGKMDESNAIQRQMFRDAVARKEPHVIEGAQVMLDPALARQHELQILDDSADVLAPRWAKREAEKHRDRALSSGRKPYKDEAYYDKLYRNTVYPRYQKQLESLKKTASNPRIPRKPGQPANSKKHSDLFTDENPKGTIHGLGFKTPAHAQKSVAKIKGSGKTHAHKTQAAIAMEQRARSMGKTQAAGVYRKFIEEQKVKTQEKKASVCEACECDPCDCGWGNYAEKTAKALSAKGRNQISEGNFALPGRRYPIHDINHGRNALSRVSQHGSESEKKQVRSAVVAKYPSLKKISS